ncbi:MAG: ribosomal-protein-alanine N-acetyltransferase [Deltaproteobacteria bacterium]|nr:MAG: ribosomal-protein-alanine N-acetyltransferase [Deltaproteobacteria bacterium]
MSEPVRIRPVRIDELRSALLRIERMSQPHPWSETAFLAEFDNPVSDILVATRNGEDVIGFLVRWRITDEVHILNVAVDPTARRQGVGRAMVRHVLDEAARDQAAFVTLEVRVSNDPAIELYRSLDFFTVGRRKEYYADNGEDALLLGWIPSESTHATNPVAPNPTG